MNKACKTRLLKLRKVFEESQPSYRVLSATDYDDRHYLVLAIKRSDIHKTGAETTFYGIDKENGTAVYFLPASNDERFFDAMEHNTVDFYEEVLD